MTLSKCLVCSVLLAVSSAASADIVAVDYLASGDGLITRDTSTNLDWLDWTQGLNLSYNDMLVQLQAGGQYQGWRYATEAELYTLLSNAGAPDVGGRSVGNVPAVTTMLGLLGANNYFGFLGAGNSSAAFLAGTTDPYGFGPFAVLAIETFDNPVTAKSGEIGAAQHSASGLGHALVRPVPAPGALALLGAVGFVGARRRRG